MPELWRETEGNAKRCR